MKKTKFFIALSIAVISVLSFVIPAFAAGTTLTDKGSGISVSGVFPNSSTKLKVKTESKPEGSVYEQKISITLLYSIYYDDGGDIDTYDGSNGVTVSVPYKKSGMHIIGFDADNDPVDTKAKYTGGCYVFSTDCIYDYYWITSSDPSAKPSKKYSFYTFKDRETKISVSGYFPKNSYLIVNNVTENYVDSAQPRYGSDFFEIKVINNFKEVSSKGTVKISVPSKNGNCSVRLLRTEQLSDEENDPDINYFDRYWYDTKAKYKRGKYVLKAGNVGTLVVATDEFYEDIGGGVKRITPKTEDLSPFISPAVTVVSIIVGVGVCLAISGLFVYKRKK